MLYGHYEKINIAGEDMYSIRFSSKPFKATKISNYDWLILNDIVAVIKQIPSGKRSYDPVTFVWTIPENGFRIIVSMLKHVGVVVEHQSLADFMNPSANNSSKPNWADQVRTSQSFKAKVESAEDFFKSNIISSATMNESEIKSKLRSLISPFVSFDLEDKESFIRGYKFAARRLHPDLGGDPVKMSELNELYAQYKELV